MPINPISAPRAAEVRQDTESEAFLVTDTKEALTVCNWRIGKNASEWTGRWAKGRTDADFGAAVGMSGDQVYQRRRVWDRFGETDGGPRHKLSWSHFFAALTWEDAEVCLDWAYANHATVAEMKAWRAAQAGETDTISESVTLGNSGNKAGSSADPFGEGDSGAGSESGAGTEAGGEEPEEEEATRLPRNGREASGGREKTPKELFADQKAKTVKTFEAAMRAIGDLNELRKVPQCDAIRKSCGTAIDAVKAVK